MKKFTTLILLVGVLCMVGCAAHIHDVGKGASGSGYEEARQWYILFGLVPLNDVDTGDMAGDAKDYTITTQSTPLDIVIGMFTSVISVQSRTVSVEK